jgi:hypothetical protein
MKNNYFMLIIALLKNVKRQEYVFENRETAARFEEKGELTTRFYFLMA